MRRAFQELGRDLGKLIDEDLREIEDDPLTGGPEGNVDLLLQIIPGDVVMYMGEEKTISVVVSKSLNVTRVVAELDPEGVVELQGETTSDLFDHPRRPDYLIGRFRLRPLVEDEETFIRITAADEEASALIEVRPERFDPDPQPPSTFQFKREHYQLAAGKRRRLEIQAPLEIVNEHGIDARAASLVEGIAVLNGGEVTLLFDEDLLYYRGYIDVEPRVAGANGHIRAQLGQLEASCVVNVATYHSGPQIAIRIVDEFVGNFRAQVRSQRDGSIRMEIYGQHPVLKRYLGPAPGYPNQESPATKAVLAEIIASEAARFVVERKYPNTADIDGAEFYHEHRNYLDKYLGRCHRMMLSDSVAAG
jgi:hypothetical protein